MTTGDTSHLLDRLRAGDDQARGSLITHASQRLQNLATRMLKDFPSVARWEQTDDVFQNALLRLWHALRDTPPETEQHFFNLAAAVIRRELIDLSRRYRGPEGIGANHATDAGGGSVESAPEKSRSARVSAFRFLPR